MEKLGGSTRRTAELRETNIDIRQLKVGYVVHYLQVAELDDKPTGVRIMRVGIIQEIREYGKMLVRTRSGKPIKTNPNKGGTVEEIHIDWVYKYEDPKWIEIRKERKPKIGEAVVYRACGRDKGYPIRGLLKDVDTKTNTSWIRFVYGEIGSGYEIESFDMPVSSSLVFTYDEWSDDEVQTLQFTINNLLPQIDHPAPTRYPMIFTDLVPDSEMRKGDGVFLCFYHRSPNFRNKRTHLLPMVVEEVTDNKVVVGGIEFSRTSIDDQHPIGAMLSTYVDVKQEPTGESMVFQSRVEMRLVAHNAWALHEYEQTVSADEYSTYVSRVRSTWKR